MKTKLLQTLVSLILIALPARSPAQGTTFTYQGRLNDNGDLANGSYDFRFRLSADSLGNEFVGSPVLTDAVAVTGGLFTVSLDFGAVFTGSNYWLQVDVKTNGAGSYTTLIPLQQVTPTPYAMMANLSSNLLGTLPTTQLTGTVGTSQLAPDSINTSHIIDGQVMNADLASDAVNSSKVLDGTLLGADLANNTVASLQLADSVSLGDAATTGQLDVYRTAAGSAAISLLGSDSQISTFGNDGLEQTRLWGPGYGELLLNNSLPGNQQAVRLTANGGSGGLLSLNNSNGFARVSLSGNNSGGSLTLFQADGGNGIFLDGDDTGAGLAYLYAADGSIGVALDGDSGGAGLMILYNTNNSARVRINGYGAGGGGQMTVNAGDGSTTLAMYGDSTGAGLINVNNSLSSTRVAIDGEGLASGGQINVYSADGTGGIQLRGDDASGGGLAYLYSGDGSLGMYLDGDSSGAGFMAVNNTNGSLRVALDGYNSYAAGQVTVYKNSGASGVILYGQDSAGDGRVVCDVIQINGGSDLSEQFDVNASNEAISPGAIVCIDPANPGKLVVSSKAYDRTVAGVVSGAGGVKPGMLMGQAGTMADGKHPVALTGRVYCLADATQGAIQPGDLITTSATPGHGMKARDHAKAQGAIIGKAMTSLDSGKGLVLVLVSLQ